MPSSKPKLVAYTTEEVIKKIEYISKHEDRSVSKEIEHIVKKHIKEFEAAHGEIKL